MNIHIKRTTEIAVSTGVKVYCLRILTNKIGAISVLLFLTLVITESYYANRIHSDKDTLYVGGVGSFIGFLLLMIAVRSVNRSWNTFYRLPRKDGSLPDLYFELTDDYIEAGITGLSYQRHSWGALTGIVERPKWITLNMTFVELQIFKSDLKDKVTLEELRSFLAGKLAKPSG